MLTKFESKSNRVKGLSFHITRPWILTSLHNGVIQLWDYRMGTLLDRFDEHDGPVRGVDFHKTQPLFVSGGDDYKIKVWDYKLRRCLFTLLGHLDYIRTVQFHNEYPWVVSCSDDQTIRIWNWQSRTCISVLTGHNHYVMCAAFHPKEDLVVSASLDQTVRVWDTTGLRKTTVRGAPSTTDDHLTSRVNSDLFGGTDAVVKYVLEGHDRGVNWASFHPTLPLIISGADDRQVKLWRMNETKAWEVDTMRGHTNNVSCVIFHPRHELLVSNSEDRSIRVWDISKRMGVQTFRRENDRFWILAAHPQQNLLAAGHDSGMIVFKLEHERPAYGAFGDHLFYVKDRYLRMCEVFSGRDTPVVSLRRSNTIGSGLGNSPRVLCYNTFNPSENNVLLTSTTDGGSYELLVFSKDGSGQVESQDSRRGSGIAAVFVARNRFAVLDKSRQIIIKNFQNEITKKISPPNGSADGMFYAGTVGRLLLRVEDKIILFENQSRRILGELQAPRVKYVVWNDACTFVALISKHAILIANRQLEHQCTITETVRTKSGAWGQNDVFVYTTLNHIKYCIPNGDSGIIRTLDVPVYVTAIRDSTMHCLDREGRTRTIAIDLTECHFKLALSKRQYGEVMKMIRNSRLCGQAIIAYLTKKGFPEVALHFVDDEKTRFKLAVACGNIDVALNSAYELNDDECWHQLGVEALRQGNQQVVEMAYQRTKNFERLSFLYLITGNTDKLQKMLKIAEMRNDVMGRFHNALFLGDVVERISILESAGQVPLALLAAHAHGLNDQVERLTKILTDTNLPLPPFTTHPKLMMPPVPIMKLEGENWPLLTIQEIVMENAPLPTEKDLNLMEEPNSEIWGGGEDEDDLLGLDVQQENKPSKSHHRRSSDLVSEGPGWDVDDDDLDLGEVELPSTSNRKQSADSSDYFAAPTPGQSPSALWVVNSSVAADHVAAGSFKTAMQLLHRQVGIINFAPLKAHFMAIHHGTSASLPTIPCMPSQKTYLQRRISTNGRDSLPYSTLTMNFLMDQIKSSYRAFTAGKFTEVKESFEAIIRAIPLMAVDTKEEGNNIKDLLGICREYLLAYYIRNELSEMTLESNPVRFVELSAYFTQCNLQPSHLLLTLNIAMKNAFKSNNFITAASFCRRLLELPEVATEKHSKTSMTAKKVLQKSEMEAKNEHQINYNDATPFVICANTLTPIYRGQAETKCPYCSASYKPEFKGHLCRICQLARIGEETIGLVVTANS